MRGIHSYMGWSHIPDIDTLTNSAEDNPFASQKTQVPGKVLVQMPVDDWLCRKLNKLNIPLVEGYPSQSTEAGRLLKDQFLRPAKSQAKWYGLYFDHKGDSTAVSRLNSSYCRIARQTGLSSTPPTLCHISQENLRKWENSASEATVVCNQAASFNKCLFKVQQDMQFQAVKAQARVLQRSYLPLVNCNTSWIPTPTSPKQWQKPWSTSQILFLFNGELNSSQEGLLSETCKDRHQAGYLGHTQDCSTSSWYSVPGQCGG